MLTSYEVWENHKLERGSESLNIYIQNVINDWKERIEANIAWRNGFLEKLISYISEAEELKDLKALDITAFKELEHYSSFVFLKRLFKDNQEQIKFVRSSSFFLYRAKPFPRFLTHEIQVSVPLQLYNLNLTDEQLKLFIPQIHTQLIQKYPYPENVQNFVKTNFETHSFLSPYILNEILLFGNKLTKIPNFGPFSNSLKKDLKLIIDLHNNAIPVESFRTKGSEIYGEHVNFRFQGNKGFPFKHFDPKQLSTYKDSHGKSFQVYTLPKGTLLFRQYHSLEDVKYSFIGYETKGSESFYLLKDHKSYFTLEPRFHDGHYGPIDVIMELQQDVKLIVGWFGEDAYEPCKDELPISVGGNSCMKEEFRTFQSFRPFALNGWIAEPFQSNALKAEVPSVEPWMIPYLKYMPHFTSQVMLHPTKLNEEIVTPYDEVDSPEKLEKWLTDNMDRFVYKPIKVFSMTDKTADSYLQYFKKEILPYTIVNNFDGTYRRIQKNIPKFSEFSKD